MATVFQRPEEVDTFDLVADLAVVLDAHDRFKPIVDFGLTIDLLAAFSEDDGPALTKNGSHPDGLIKILGPEARAAKRGDVLIIVDGARYEKSTQRQREALLAHELYHVAFKTHPEDILDENDREKVVQRPDLDPYGRPVVKLIPDDWTVTGFAEVAEWYGEDSGEVRSHRAMGRRLEKALSVLPFMAAPDTPTLRSIGMSEATAAEVQRIIDTPDATDRRPIRSKCNDDLEAAFGAIEPGTKKAANFPTPDDFAPPPGIVEAHKEEVDGNTFNVMTTASGERVAALAKPRKPKAEEADDPGETCPSCEGRGETGTGVTCALCNGGGFVTQDEATEFRGNVIVATEEPKPKRKAREPKPVIEVDDGSALFVVRRGSAHGTPEFAIRAPSKLAAVYHANTLGFRHSTTLDDGTTARLGLKVVEVDKQGGVVAQAPPPAYERPAARTKPRTRAGRAPA